MARWRGAPILIMSVASLAGCASQQKKDAPVVRDVNISGNDEISSRRIKKKILTTETRWWPFASKQYFDPVTWQADLERIQRFYAANGFYQAEVVKDEVRPDPPDGVALEVSVSEGKPTRVGKVEVEGLAALPPADRGKVLENLPLAPGAVFREEDWAATKRVLADRLRNRGYARAKAEGRALVDVKTQLANLTLIVDPGRRYVFGDIQVDTAGGARVPASVVWEQVRLAVKEGKPYSDAVLEEAQRRLFGLGLFATIGVTTGEPDDAAGRIPVRVIVREGTFRTLRLGAGARIDAIRNEARAIGDWTNRDFLGGQRRLTLHAELGWAFLPNVFAVATNDVSVGPRSGPIARLRLEFDQPRFLWRPSLRWRNTLEIDRTLEQTYDAFSTRVVTGVVWQAHSTLSIFPSYRLEADYLDGSPINSAVTNPLTLGCDATGDSCLVWLSYLDALITWDRRDKVFDPRHGSYLSLSLQQGGGPLGGNFDYVRVLPDARIYGSFGDGDALTLSARLRAGELWPWSGNPDDSAVVTRFYAGGSISMRGFADRRLSPLLLAPPPSGASNVELTLPIGGNGLIDGSFEARYSLFPSLRVAAFVDFGQVTHGRLTPGDIAGVLWAVGVGVRWITPIGPIRVDLARRLPFGDLPTLYQVDAAGAIVAIPYAANDSCFGLGGSHVVTPVPDGLCLLHIAIGEAF
jgi:outer membrane protein assembly factor BamA